MQATPWIVHEQLDDYTLEHPEGWSVGNSRSPLLIVTDPSALRMAILEPLGMTLGRGTPGDILRAGRFTATDLFPDAVLGSIAENADLASCLVNFLLPGGKRGRARVTCKPTKWCQTIFAVAAPEETFDQAEPQLARILDSFRTLGTADVLSAYEMQCSFNGTGRPGLKVSWRLKPVASQPAPFTALESPFVRFVDPTVGGFQLEVPRGWQVRGGLHHPALGDRRWYLEAQSPNNITVLLGDPGLPQDFCHNSAVWGEVMVPYPQGCSFLSLRADPRRLAGYYLKNVLPQRFGTLKITNQRDRPDLAAVEGDRLRRQGFALAPSFKLSTHETRFEVAGRVGCCYATCGLDKSQPGQWITGMTMWSGSVATWLAPPNAAAIADQAVDHMKSTFRSTPRMLEVAQQDERFITANGMSAQMRQQSWFDAQQAIHRTQEAQGDLIVGAYWNQQQVNDRLSQDRSDAMLDRQRLSDDGAGQTYDVSAGHNYYWLDQQTGQIYGTDNSNPPDYTRNYTELRKL